MRARSAILAVLCALAVILVFAPSLSHGWLNWDDDLLLTGNPFYRGLGWAQIRWAFTTAPGGAYQPLGFLSYGLDYVAWGMNPRGYHLSGVLLHALNAALVFLAARGIMSAAGEEPSAALDAAAVFAALVFALHPLRVESVSWIAERRDPLSGAFWLGAVLVYLRVRSPGRAPRPLWAVYALFVAACLAKALAVTLPLVLLILDVGVLRRPLKTALREKRTMLLFGAALGLLGVYWQGQTRAAWSWADHGLAARLAQACYGLVFYLWKTVWPAGLSPFYALPVPLVWTQPRFLAAAAAVTLAGVFLWRVRRDWPWPAFAALSYALIILPVSGLAQSGAQLVADRYSYLACLPWALLAGGAYLAAARRPGGQVAAAIVSIVVTAALAGGCLRQQAHWRSSESLWTRAAAVDPGSATARLKLGALRASQGRIRQAALLFEEALARDGDCVPAQDRLAQLSRGDSGQAAESFELRREIEKSPVCRTARLNRAVARAELGDLAYAARELETIVLAVPEDRTARANLARVRAELNGRGSPRAGVLRVIP